VSGEDIDVLMTYRVCEVQKSRRTLLVVVDVALAVPGGRIMFLRGVHGGKRPMYSMVDEEETASDGKVG
jgi:hypothetical protein